MGKRYFVKKYGNEKYGNAWYIYDKIDPDVRNHTGCAVQAWYSTAETAVSRCAELNKEAGDVENGVRYFVASSYPHWHVFDSERMGEPDARCYQYAEEAIEACYKLNFPEVKVKTKKSWIVTVENGFGSKVEASRAAERVAKNHAGEKVNLYAKVAEVVCEQPKPKWTEIKEK